LNTNDNFSEVKSLSPIKTERLRYLMELGLTRTQAILYLNLSLNGESDVRLLAHRTSLPRTEIYRALSELQEKGFVDKEVGSPLKFSAVPPSLCLQDVINHKYNQIKEMEKNLKKFTNEFNIQQGQEKDDDFKITIIEGRERIISKIKQQHDSARSTVDIVSFLPRFLVIAQECLSNYRKACKRGVQYRIILGLPPNQQSLSESLPEKIKRAHSNKNTKIKTTVGVQKVNSATFDGKQTSFSYYPDRLITQSPLILTNHPCLVEFAQNSFEKMWDSL